MSDEKDGASRRSAREEREAAALRENLRRRKAQARARRDPPQSALPDDHKAEPDELP